MVRASVRQVNDSPQAPEHERDSLQVPDVVDLDAIEADLHNVEVALDRLADGTYWTDEVTGQPIPDEVLVLDPTARRA